MYRFKVVSELYRNKCTDEEDTKEKITRQNNTLRKTSQWAHGHTLLQLIGRAHHHTRSSSSRVQRGKISNLKIKPFEQSRPARTSVRCATTVTGTTRFHERLPAHSTTTK